MYADSPHFRRLVEAIRQHPDDDALRLALSDLIESEADAPADLARAEFVRVQVRRAGLRGTDPERAQLEARERELLATYEATWRQEVPDLAGVRWGPFERGFLTAVLCGTVHPLRDQAAALFTGTPLVRVRILNLTSTDEVADLALAPGLAQVRELDLTDLPRSWHLCDLLASPYLGQLLGLTLQNVALRGDELTALGEAALPELRHLSLAGNAGLSSRVVTDFLGELGGQLRALDLTDCAAAFQATFPTLESLETLSLAGVAKRRTVLEDLAEGDLLPALRRLDLRRCGLDLGDVQLLLASPLGQRAELLLDDNPGTASLRQVVHVSTTAEPALLDLTDQTLGYEGIRAALAVPRRQQPREVRLTNAGLRADELAELLESPRFRGVEVLDLSFNLLGEGDLVAVLLASDLPGLRRLNLTTNGLSLNAVRRLRASPRFQNLDELTLGGNPGLDLHDALTAALLADPTTLDLSPFVGMLSPEELVRLLDWPLLVGVRTLHLPWVCTTPEVLAALEAGGLPEVTALTWRGNSSATVDTWHRLTAWLGSAWIARLRELRVGVDQAHLRMTSYVDALLDAPLARLEALHLDRLGLTPYGCERLRDWPVLARLRTLSLDEPQSEEGLATLLTGERLPALANLTLHQHPHAPALEPLLRGGLLPQLRSLRLVGPGLHTSDVRRLTESGQLGNLTCLALPNNPALGEGTGRALALCPELTNLERLDLTGCNLGDAGFRWLVESPHLSRLAVLSLNEPESRHGRCAQALSRLAAAGLPALRELSLSHHALDAAELAALAASPRLAQLTHLDLADQREPLGNAAALALVASPHFGPTLRVNLARNAIRYGGCRAVRISPLAGRIDLTGNPGVNQEGEVETLLATPAEVYPLANLTDSCLPELLNRPELEQVRELDLSHGFLTVAGLRLLAAAPRLVNLRRLTLARQQPPLDGEALPALLAGGVFPHLEVLSLPFNAVTLTAAGLEAVAARPALALLGLPSNRVARAGVRALLEQPALRGRLWCDLRHNAGWVLERGLHLAEGAPTLELTSAPGLVDELLAHLRTRRDPLHELHLTGEELSPVQYRRLWQARGLRALRSLTVRNANFDTEAVRALAACGNFPGLERLDLSGNPLQDVTCLLESATLPALTDLRLECVSRSREDEPSAGHFLVRHPGASRLRKLSLAGAGLQYWSHTPERDDLGHLLRWPGLRHLTHLDLSDNSALYEAAWTAQRDAAAQLANLTSLNLAGVPQLRETGLRAILDHAGPPCLRELGLRNTGLGVGGIRFLATAPRLRELRELNLADNCLRSRELAPLFVSATLARLEVLDLSENPLTEADLLALLQAPFAPRLRVLRLGDIEVPDLWVRLGAALPRLEELSLVRCRFAPACLTALAAAPLLGRLRRLVLTETRVAAGGYGPLFASPRLAQLQSLEAEYANVTPADVVRLASNGHLHRLSRLGLAHNLLDAAGVTALADAVALHRVRTLTVALQPDTNTAFARLLARYGLAVVIP